MEGFNLGHTYKHKFVISKLFREGYELFHYGERFAIGEAAIMVKDLNNEDCHWFIFNSYDDNSGSLYKYVCVI